jgi:hypothetical protein
MVRFSSRVMFWGCVVALLVCASCKSANMTSGDGYVSRTETVKMTQLGTLKLHGRPKVEKQKRVLVRLYGTANADYHVLTGPIRHSTPQIPGPPTPRLERGKVAPDKQLNPNAVMTATDDAETSTHVTTAFPFFFLTSGYAYISGTAPAAQTEHVIAGSDSTKFIVEVDPMAGSTPDGYVHRVFVLEGTVEVQALDNAGNRRGPLVLVEATKYVECRNDSGTWEIYGPALYPTGANDFVSVVEREAQQAGL